MDARTVYSLDALRSLLGRPFTINSAYRTAEHNKTVGGSPKSAHLDGLAVDISTRGWNEADKIDLIVYARKLGFNGVGIAPTFIHLDQKPRVASWIYQGHKTLPIALGSESKYV